MSGLPDTFPCPWCGVSYPARPVLVSKAVRCKGCRNGFVLQADGVATKIEEPPAAAPRAKPDQAAAPELAVEDVVALARKALAEDVVVLPPRPPVEDVVVRSSMTPQTPPPAQPKSERLTKRKTEHLEAARAQMAAQLAEIQHKAAESEVAKREERKSERIAKSGSGTAAPSSGDAKRSARQAILTGEGERLHRESRLWWLGLGVAAAIVLLLVFVLNLSSATREALQRYAAPVEAGQNRYPLLGEVLRARAWLATARSMRNGPLLATELSDASFGAERAIFFEPLAEQLAGLKGLRLDDELGLWLAPADLDKARRLLAGRRGAEASKLLVPTRLRHAVHSQVVEKLGLAEEDAIVVIDLLTGTPPRDGEPVTRRILDLGELPDRVVVRPFRGRRGSMLVDLGRPPYKPEQGPYAGAILRFEGARWPIGWRVLHLEQVK